jgi:hypothetical protein
MLQINAYLVMNVCNILHTIWLDSVKYVYKNCELQIFHTCLCMEIVAEVTVGIHLVTRPQ